MIKKWENNPACGLRLHMVQNTSIPVAVVLDWGIRIIRIAVCGPQDSYSHGSRKLLSVLTCFIPVWPWSFCLSPRHTNWAVKVIPSLPHKGNFTLLFVRRFAANCHWSEKHYYCIYCSWKQSLTYCLLGKLRVPQSIELFTAAAPPGLNLTLFSLKRIL